MNLATELVYRLSLPRERLKLPTKTTRQAAEGIYGYLTNDRPFGRITE